jgi:hypothetical protein
MQKYHDNTLVAEEQPSEIITQQQKILNAAESYIAAGFALTPCEGKRPVVKGWNRRGKANYSHRPVSRLRRQYRASARLFWHMLH